MMMFKKNNKENKDVMLTKFKSGYDKVYKTMERPEKDYDSIKKLVEGNDENNILKNNINKSKNINLTKSKNKKSK